MSDNDDVKVAGERDQNDDEAKAAAEKLAKIEEKAKNKRLTFDEAVQLFNGSKPTRALRLLLTNGFVRVRTRKPNSQAFDLADLR